MKICIVGAGIGGCVAAMLLAEQGHDVLLFEAVPELNPLGVGINLLPHAASILDGLGLCDTLESQGVATRELVYYNKHGQRIWGEPRGRYAGYPVPQISIHRGILQMTLFNAAKARLGDDRIFTGHRLESVTGEGPIAAVFVTSSGDNVTIKADMLIGADGIHSTLRRLRYPDEGLPNYGGRILWRATSKARPFLTGSTMIMAGHQDCKFVAYPIGVPDDDGLQTLNWIAELTIDQMPERENWNKEGNKQDFEHSFADWQFDWLDVPDLIKSSDRVFEFPLVDRDPLPRWSFGATTLLGDAAHPMYPIGSNGASQAILDADALTRALAAHADPVAALAAYEAERLPATAAIVLANRGNGPEQCMQIAEERAPLGFADIETVMPRAELEAIAARYKAVAGFSKDAVTARTA
jgi:5-methylphenazine-1-carboxylate 1-monooxygenase